MPLAITQLVAGDAEAVASLWQAAVDERRSQLGLAPMQPVPLVLSRPGAFGVGVFGTQQLLSMAVAMPALADDGRSTHNVPGLAHISSVATFPGHWGQGLARQAVQAIMGQASRRGFARVQLWTHEDNAAARHLYESLAFQATGRSKLDDFGEAIVHYVRNLPSLPSTSRPAARLVCLGPEDRILLVHWRDPLDGYQLWEPPGGGIEAGESAYEAVLREWAEETGLPVPRVRPTPTAVGRELVWNGQRSIVEEDFFLGYADEAGVPVTEAATAVEQEAYLGYAWVHWRDLDSLDDPVEPDLLPVLRRLKPNGPWAVEIRSKPVV